MSLQYHHDQNDFIDMINVQAYCSLTFTTNHCHDNHNHIGKHHELRLHFKHQRPCRSSTATDLLRTFTQNLTASSCATHATPRLIFYPRMVWLI